MTQSTQKRGKTTATEWNPEKDTLGHAMEILGYNNSQLAELVGAHRNTVSNWRKGFTPTPRPVILLLQDRIKLLNLAQRVRNHPED